jgi:N-terminal half of MaoC dehydratase
VNEELPRTVDREHANAESGDDGAPFNWHVEAGKAREFGLACLDPGASDPTYVPITFTEVAAHFWEPPEARAGMDELDRSRLLHGEQEMTYARPIRIGERLTGHTRLKDRYVKTGRRGGEMRFTVFETTFLDEADAVVVRSTKTLLEVREAPHD